MFFDYIPGEKDALVEATGEDIPDIYDSDSLQYTNEDVF